MKSQKIIKSVTDFINSFSDTGQKIEFLNTLKKAIHEAGPFKNEPVDCVTWEKQDFIYANDYNPNSVAPKEMELLYLSIKADGYTQPIVTFKEENGRQVVDGFHRSKVARFYPDINDRILGYMPVVTINQDRIDKSDRMASTIRHNRARGKHAVESMSDIVMELKRRNWSDEKIARELGMEPDEVLRLAQITGLSEIFSDQEFSEAWEIREDENDNFVLND
jgi:ParB-like chromosome segregation protein Spo0J